MFFDIKNIKENFNKYKNKVSKRIIISYATFYIDNIYRYIEITVDHNKFTDEDKFTILRIRKNDKTYKIFYYGLQKISKDKCDKFLDLFKYNTNDDYFLEKLKEIFIYDDIPHHKILDDKNEMSKIVNIYGIVYIYKRNEKFFLFFLVDYYTKFFKVIDSDGKEIIYAVKNLERKDDIYFIKRDNEKITFFHEKKNVYLKTIIEINFHFHNNSFTSFTRIKDKPVFFFKKSNLPFYGRNDVDYKLGNYLSPLFDFNDKEMKNYPKEIRKWFFKIICIFRNKRGELSFYNNISTQIILKISSYILS
jgi:hypothetical protein